jgi:hypothetical protein
MSDVRHVTIDHILPESLLSKPTELLDALKEYGLAKTFEINSFENWVPAHSHCNATKRTTLYSSCPAMVKNLHEAGKKGKKARSRYNGIIKSLERGTAVSQIESLIELGKISKDEVIALCGDTPQVKRLVASTYDEVISRLSEKWKVISVDNNLGVASDGQYSGLTWVGKEEPDSSWRCPTCGSMGPWSGALCKNCGHFSDD